jgi:DNA polymerase III alpha subunit
MAGQKVTMAGMVSQVRRITTKGGKPMAFAQLEDLQGSIEVVIFPTVWEKTKEMWESERVLLVRGTVSLRGQSPSLLADSATNEITTARPAEAASAPAPGGPTHLHIMVPRGDDLEAVIRRLGQIYDLLQRYPGDDRFSLYVENGGQGQIQISFPNDTTHHCLQLEQELRQLVGAGALRIETATPQGGMP